MPETKLAKCLAEPRRRAIRAMGGDLATRPRRRSRCWRTRATRCSGSTCAARCWSAPVRLRDRLDAGGVKRRPMDALVLQRRRCRLAGLAARRTGRLVQDRQVRKGSRSIRRSAYVGALSRRRLGTVADADRHHRGADNPAGRLVADRRPATTLGPGCCSTLATPVSADPRRADREQMPKRRCGAEQPFVPSRSSTRRTVPSRSRRFSPCSSVGCFGRRRCSPTRRAEDGLRQDVARDDASYVACGRAPYLMSQVAGPDRRAQTTALGADRGSRDAGDR